MSSYPNGGYRGAARAAARAQGFQGGTAALMGFNQAGRALARRAPYLGTAFLTAELLHRLWQRWQTAAPVGYSTRGWDLCPTPSGTGCAVSGWNYAGDTWRFFQTTTTCVTLGPCVGDFSDPTAAHFPAATNAWNYWRLTNPQGQLDPRWWLNRQLVNTVGTPFAPEYVAEERPAIAPIARIGEAVAPESVWERKKPLLGTYTFPLVMPGLGSGVVARPDRRAITYPVPVPRVARVPAPGVHELKVRAFGLLRGLLHGYNATTEAGDFVEALWRALPGCARTVTPTMRAQRRLARANGWNPQYRAANPGYNVMLGDVTRFLRHLVAHPTLPVDQVCGGRLVGGVYTLGRPGRGLWAGRGNAAARYAFLVGHNLAHNEAEDRIWGGIGSELGRISRGLNLPFGIQSMLRASRRGRRL